MDHQLDDQSEQTLATEIGRTFLHAQRLADEIIADARRKADQVARSSEPGSRTVDVVLARTAAGMLLELDGVEHQLLSSQTEIKRLLDEYPLTGASRTDASISVSEDTADPVERKLTQPEPTGSDGTDPDSWSEEDWSTQDQPRAHTNAMVMKEREEPASIESSEAQPTTANIPDSAVPSEARTTRTLTTRVDPQWAPPSPAVPRLQPSDGGMQVNDSGPATTGPEISSEPSWPVAPAVPPARRYSGARANVIALVIALAVLTVLLVVVNVL